MKYKKNNVKSKEYKGLSNNLVHFIIWSLVLIIGIFYYYWKNNSSSSLDESVATKEYQPFRIVANPDIVYINKTLSNLKVRTVIDNRKELIRTMRQDKVVMSKDPAAIRLTNELQNITRCYLLSQYGVQPYHVEMIIKFPSVMTDKIEELKSNDGIRKLLIELAPIEYIPYSVFTFLEIVRTFKQGTFNRNAGHVLQSAITADFKGGMVYMEFDRRYPHVKHTMGFAGRGGGNAFYINTIDNTVSHGPGTDRGGKDPEADSNFGKVIDGNDIIYLMQKQPLGKDKSPMGFVEGKENFIDILSLKVVKPTAEEMNQVRKDFYINSCLEAFNFRLF